MTKMVVAVVGGTLEQTTDALWQLWASEIYPVKFINNVDVPLTRFETETIKYIGLVKDHKYICGGNIDQVILVGEVRSMPGAVAQQLMGSCVPVEYQVQKLIV